MREDHNQLEEVIEWNPILFCYRSGSSFNIQITSNFYSVHLEASRAICPMFNCCCSLINASGFLSINGISYGSRMCSTLSGVHKIFSILFYFYPVVSTYLSDFLLLLLHICFTSFSLIGASFYRVLGVYVVLQSYFVAFFTGFTCFLHELIHCYNI